MPLYEIRSLDVWGNAAEGFSINDERREGEVYVPPEGDVVAALIKEGVLNRNALDEHEAGRLQVEYGDSTIEISETDTEIAVTGRNGENRWLDVNGTLEEVRALAAEEALNPDRGDGQLLEEGESPDDIDEVEDQRPLLFLNTPMLHGDGPDEDGNAFWRTKIGDLDIVVGLEGTTIGVKVSARYDPDDRTTDRFEWDVGYWKRHPSFGFDPFTSEELVPTSKQVDELFVALDYFLETGTERGSGPGSPNVAQQLKKAGFPVRECGLNADWSVRAWFLGPWPGDVDRGANRTNGGIYLLDAESDIDGGIYLLDAESDIDGVDQFALVRQYIEVDGVEPTEPVEELKEGPLAKVIAVALKVLR